MHIETIRWRHGAVELIDQTLLPQKFRYVRCRDIGALWKAIRTLQVRGAPALGIAGALGVALGAKSMRTHDTKVFLKRVHTLSRYLASSRPTAVNLFWALDRVERAARKNTSLSVKEMKKVILDEALAIVAKDKATCRRMARYGASLIRSGDTILTHCNAGGLATADYGTALGVLFEAKKQKKKIRVYADETRPLLQGARLTTWELMRQRIDTILICDNMAASLMARGMIDKIFVGADRIATNGDFANKIGTYGLAVLAKEHGIPLYVVAPRSSIDFSLRSGDAIPIEQRDPDEVRSFAGVYCAPRSVKVYNPAFDVTPHRFVRAIVTEYGIFRTPFGRTLKDMQDADTFIR